MRLRRVAAGVVLFSAGLDAPGGAEGAAPVVREAASFESRGKVVDVAVFRPDGGQKYPAVIYLHGGGFSFRDPMMERFNAELAARGLVVLAPHYLLNHTGAMDWQATASNAVTFARGLPGVDPDRIGLAGLSMGGQVVLSAAARDRRVKAVAGFFTAWPGTLPDEPVGDLPPALLLNGAADPIIPLGAAFQLDGLLAGRGMPFERRVYPGLGHGFGEGAAFDDAVIRTAAFFGGRAEGLGPGLDRPGLGTPIAGQVGTAGADLGAGEDALDAPSTWSGPAAVTLKKKTRRRPTAAKSIAPGRPGTLARVAKSSP